MKRQTNSKIFQLCKVGINRLICLCRGHEWEVIGVADHKETNSCNLCSLRPYTMRQLELTLKCARCGKIKEEVI